MNARAAIFTTYSAQAALRAAQIETEHAPTQFGAYAMQAGAFKNQATHYAEKADAEAANTQRICNSLAEYEKAAPIRAIEWDELHDFLDYLRAGLEMRYDDCDEMQTIKDSFRRLQRDLCELESVKTAEESLAAFTDARISESKVAA